MEKNPDMSASAKAVKAGTDQNARANEKVNDMGKVHDKIKLRNNAKVNELAVMIQSIAMVAHEVNRAYCQSLGDDSQPTWEDAPEWQKESAWQGVAFHIENPDAGPDASHVNWAKQKLRDGWKHGEVKDPEAKTHPCLVKFSELPQEQQAKDYLFRAVVHSMLNGGYHGK